MAPCRRPFARVIAKISCRRFISCNGHSPASSWSGSKQGEAGTRRRQHGRPGSSGEASLAVANPVGVPAARTWIRARSTRSHGMRSARGSRSARPSTASAPREPNRLPRHPRTRSSRPVADRPVADHLAADHSATARSASAHRDRSRRDDRSADRRCPPLPKRSWRPAGRPVRSRPARAAGREGPWKPKRAVEAHKVRGGHEDRKGPKGQYADRYSAYLTNNVGLGSAKFLVREQN